MRYHWIIFDADGTLFDFDGAEFDAITNTFRDFSIIPSENAIGLYRAITESLFRRLEQGDIVLDELKTERFSILFQQLGISVDVDSFSEAYLENLSLSSRLLPEANEIVRKLSESFNMIILTNGIASVQRSRLERSSIGPFFKDIIISDEVGYAKPSAEIFHIAFQSMGHPALNEVLMVGDSLTSDIEGGNNYGIDTCWICPELNPGRKSSATYEISRLGELLDILRNP
ncbi:MAG: noncanonical pyrimidine nucleotidase, YjjG family [Proteobacteria bacterium]|nr:noncanonical pyrimidine nucleotidase, YjjG family [Pseudomonadota bacterium]